MEQAELDQWDALLGLVGAMAESLAEIARHTQPALPEAPDWQRPIEQFNGFDWESIEAAVVRVDAFGPALVEWGGRLWTRRSPENKFGEAIWFSRPAGKDAEGAVKYLRLITFRKVAEAEPLSRAAERAVRAVQRMPAAADKRMVEQEDGFDALVSEGERRQAAAEAVRAKLLGMAAGYNGQGGQPATDDQRQRAFNNLRTLCGNSEERRHAVVRFLFGKESLTELTAGEAQALRDWVHVTKAGEEWLPAATAVADLKVILTG